MLLRSVATSSGSTDSPVLHGVKITFATVMENPGNELVGVSVELAMGLVLQAAPKQFVTMAEWMKLSTSPCDLSVSAGEE